MNNPTRILSIILTVIMLLAVFPAPVATAASAASEIMDTRALAMINKPGTVLVLSTWTADMRIREFSIDDSLFDDVADIMIEMVENGEFPSDENTLYTVIMQLVAQYMSSYIFYTGNVEERVVSVDAIGSGFIVTPDGYLITNAHVVEQDHDELYRYFAVTNLRDLADEGISEMVAEMRRSGFEIPQSILDALYSAFFDILTQSFELDNMKVAFNCVLGNVTPGSDISVRGISMDLRKIGEPYPGKDIAILKINGQSNLPTVTLGDDALMKTGDRVYAMGYPGAATLHESIDLNQSLQEPTLTQGIISAKKQMEGGWGIIQMDAAIHYGNSGGPLFNEYGEVIGVNTFGSVDDSTGALVGGMNFAIPISIAKQFLNEINVTPSESTFTTNFKRALDSFNSGEYESSIEILRAINDTNPGFPVVQELLADSWIAFEANPPTTTTATEPETTTVTTTSEETEELTTTTEREPDTTSATTTRRTEGGDDGDSGGDRGSGSSSSGGDSSGSGSSSRDGDQKDNIFGMSRILFFIILGVVVLLIAGAVIFVLRKKPQQNKPYASGGQAMPFASTQQFPHQTPPSSQQFPHQMPPPSQQTPSQTTLPSQHMLSQTPQTQQSPPPGQPSQQLPLPGQPSQQLPPPMQPSPFMSPPRSMPQQTQSSSSPLQAPPPSPSSLYTSASLAAPLPPISPSSPISPYSPSSPYLPQEPPSASSPPSPSTPPLPHSSSPSSSTQAPPPSPSPSTLSSTPSSYSPTSAPAPSASTIQTVEPPPSSSSLLTSSPSTPTSPFSPTSPSSPSGQFESRLSTSKAVVCQQCKAILSSTAKFCDNCGAAVQKPKLALCPKCGKALSPTSKFCDGCGNRIE